MRNDLLDALLPHHEQLARLESAIRSVVTMVLPNPLHAAAGLLGCAAQWLREQGIPDEEVIAHLRRAQVALPSIEVAVRRAGMHEVRAPESSVDSEDEG